MCRQQAYGCLSQQVTPIDWLIAEDSSAPIGEIHKILTKLNDWLIQITRESLAMFRYYLYQSQSAISRFDIEDLNILRTALNKNAEFGVTGFLYKSRSHFFQYFEGKDRTANQLLANLKNDKRHFDIQILLSGEAPYPRFADWSMGYADYRDSDPHNCIDLGDSPTSILRKLERHSQSHSARLPNLRTQARYVEPDTLQF